MVWGIFLFPSLAQGAYDFDQDGLSDQMEVRLGTQSYAADTDGDGYSDLEEIKNGYSPLLPQGKTLDTTDTDKDKLSDMLEAWFASNPFRADTDGDGFNDYEEVMSGFSPSQVVTSTRYERNIVVDRTKQTLHYFVDGVKLHNVPVSTGNPRTPTPAGQFAIERKIPTLRYVGPGYDLPGVKWNMQFKPKYYIHSAYWHNDFGKRTRSHGCINLREADAAFLYKYIDVGVLVEVAGETPKRFRVGT